MGEEGIKQGSNTFYKEATRHSWNSRIFIGNSRCLLFMHMFPTASLLLSVLYSQVVGVRTSL